MAVPYKGFVRRIAVIEISFFWLVGYFDKAADTQRMTTYIDIGSKIFKNVCLLDGLNTLNFN